MLRVVPFKSAARACEYYTQALVKEDYWSQKNQTPGIWQGKTAAMLGLEGEVKAKDFAALANNQHPFLDETLTLRNRDGRVVGSDFNFGCPKSVSILYAMTGDPDIIRVFQDAVSQMMEAVEADAETRVRKGGKHEQRTTGNLVWSTFIHHTSRPVGGIPDPHLHSHSFVQNITRDAKENCYKACKFRLSKQKAPYYEAIGRSHLAHGLRQLGYDVRKVGKAFEIVGIPRTLVQKYSRRSMQIDQAIAELGMTGAKARDRIGATSRESKQSGMTVEQTLAAWTARLDADEKLLIQEVIRNKGTLRGKTVDASQCVDYALQHCFTNDSVVKHRDLFREAVAFGYGHVLPNAIDRELGKRPLIHGKVAGVDWCTSEPVLSEERFIIAYGRSGKGQHQRFYNTPYQFQRDYLSAEQKLAVLEILYSRDRVMAIQGGAGVGKTTTVHELVDAIEKSGKRVFTFAPTASASYDMLERQEGFTGAKTLESLLRSKQLQKEVRGQVIWLDEAGQVSVPDMRRLFEIAGHDTRILLTADLRQHGPVSRGAAFRLLLEKSQILCPEVRTIRRQTEDRYRAAAQAIGKGDVDTAFEHLQEMGALHEIADHRERYRELAKAYVESLSEQENSFLVSPTHSESAKITTAIRERLREVKQLGPGRTYLRLQDLRWSDAQKTRSELYEAGFTVQFHQNARGGIVRGARYEVTGQDVNGQVLVSDGKHPPMPLDLESAAKFRVFRSKEIELARGDVIRMTRNGFFLDGKRYNNGDTYQIKRILKSGSMKLDNGSLIKRDHGHLTHGFVSTSYSSQGKTTDPVFIAQSSGSDGASSLNQFNVSLTRGRTQIRIYTDSIAELKEAVKRAEFRLTATEFTDRHAMQQQDDKDPHFPYEVTPKEKEAIFNEKGEFRHTPQFIKHDVGGSFTKMVSSRRQTPGEIDPEVHRLREQVQQDRQKEAEQDRSLPANDDPEKWAKRVAAKDSPNKPSPSLVKPVAAQGGTKNWTQQFSKKPTGKTQQPAPNQTESMKPGSPSKPTKNQPSPGKDQSKAKTSNPPAKQATGMQAQSQNQKASNKGQELTLNINIMVNGKKVGATATASAKAPPSTPNAKNKSKGKAKSPAPKPKAPKPPVVVVKKGK